MHADIVREVERTLRLLGMTNAEIAAISSQYPQALYDAIRRAGGKSDILRFIGSYGGTISDEEVLDGLRHWNDCRECS